MNEQAPAARRPRPADRAAFLVSAVTSPFLVTGVTALVVVSAMRPTLGQLLLWVAIAGVFGAVLPFGAVYVLWRTGRVTDMHVAVRSQRTLPLTATLLSAAVGVATLRVAGAPPPLLGLGAAFVVNGVALTLISMRWKVSFHAATTAAAIVAFALLFSPWFLTGLFAMPLVFWARLYRGRHTLAQGVVATLVVSVLTATTYLGVVEVLGPGGR